jgi:7-carboxy-7-deazaguanine synthase
MTYAVKELFTTLQGEGYHTGRRAVFVRFAGCNLWSGHERDRARAICRFCDTDFVGTDGPGGRRFSSPSSLAAAVETAWATGGITASVPTNRNLGRFVVLTGGEPLLQVDEPLIDALHDAGFTVAVETNGTLPVVETIDWICVSPKAGSELVQLRGNELKLIFPQPGAEPDRFISLPFDHFFIQPMDGPVLEQNTRLAMAYCREHPPWLLSIQTHKYLGIP